MQHISVVRTRLFGRLQIENRYTPPPRNVQSLASRKRVIMVMATCSNPAKAVMTPRELKAEMRRERLALRDAIAPEERAEKSLAMVRHAADAVRLQPGEIVSGFLPIRSEADIRPLMTRLGERGARLCVPVILDKQTIVFRELIDGAQLVASGFGTIGPGPDAPELDP